MFDVAAGLSPPIFWGLKLLKYQTDLRLFCHTIDHGESAAYLRRSARKRARSFGGLCVGRPDGVEAVQPPLSTTEDRLRNHRGLNP